ncbi:MAG: NAD-dependent epimerase/dehydratase family protein, partial [Chromatocurvus sp.]
MKVLVTGAAGFIGYHVTGALLARGDSVVGVDNLNAYYDVGLKRARLGSIDPEKAADFQFVECDITDASGMRALFDQQGFDAVINLAAQAGVRYSIDNPQAYIDSNINGFLSILECCRRTPVKHLVYASSSSVYGANRKMPFAVTDNVDHPVSLYAATKKANELMAHTYSHLYGIPTTGLRFFTVYGPWGRPDMAYFLFTRAILEGQPIKVFNEGRMQRDFTYIDDIVDGVLGALDRPPVADPLKSTVDLDAGSSSAAYRVFNIGNNRPVALMDFIGAIETALGLEAIKEYHPMQPGDV